MNEQAYYISRCRQLIEQKLGWGNSDDWQTQDFDILAEKIFDATNFAISTSTLKRIWGKVKYESSPNLSTLNALAMFVGFESWRAFTANEIQPSESLMPRTSNLKNTDGKKRIYWLMLPAFLVVCFFGFRLLKNTDKTINYAGMIFSSKPVTTGIPNTVIFDYDASRSNADSVFIQQSWDRKLRTKVDKSLHQFTTSYYRPGYYKAKLILNDSIVKEHDVFIETDGWMGLVEKKEIPVYFKKKEITKETAIGINEADLHANGIELKNEIPTITFYNISHNNEVRAGQFELNALIKNTFKAGNGICQRTAVGILGKNGLIIVPLSIKGCVGEINLMLGTTMIGGKTHDLSGFGVDFSNFVQIKCIVKDHRIKISVNGKSAYEADMTEDIGDIVGTAIQFNGTGMIKSCSVKSL